MPSRMTRRALIRHGAALGTGVMLAPGLIRAAAPAREASAADSADRYLRAVRAFADTVLSEGRDRYGPGPTPLFVDGINVDTREPVRWVHDDRTWICSNLASQQNLFRTLAGLSNLTGEDRYREAAAEATAWHFAHLVRSCGLLQWGGHRFYDAATGSFVGEQDTHELKCNYPFYELMWQIDRTTTERLIKAMWNAHILEWSVLDMNRHGAYEKPMGRLWDHDYAPGPPFFEGRGLTFINTGSDLYYAGALLHGFTGDDGALNWSKRLFGRYVEARDPETGLGAYQYSRPIKTRDLPPEMTGSSGGDRAFRQFGPEFGERALEGRMLDPGRATAIYGRASICQMHLAEQLGDAGRMFLTDTRDGLLAYARHGYDPDAHRVRGMLTDGTVITPDDVIRPGYYSAGTFRERPPGTILFQSYAMAYRLTREPAFWATLRAMARGHGLGDLGPEPDRDVKIDPTTRSADVSLLLGMLDIVRVAPARAFLDLAYRIGDNILDARFHGGLFVRSRDHVNASFDEVEPLALLTLAALARNEPRAVPTYTGGRGYIHGPHDGLGRTTDARAIWSITRDA